VWTTHGRRTDAPAEPLRTTRITRAEVAARNRRARFPAAPYGGVFRIASAANLHSPAAVTGDAPRTGWRLARGSDAAATI
jgi:hypothetical protein